MEHDTAVGAGLTRGCLHAHIFDALARFDTAGRGRNGFVVWGLGYACGSEVGGGARGDVWNHDGLQKITPPSLLYFRGF